MSEKIDIISVIAWITESQGSSRAVKLQSGAFINLEDTGACSGIFCAMDCIKTPACVIKIINI